MWNQWKGKTIVNVIVGNRIKLESSHCLVSNCTSKLKQLKQYNNKSQETHQPTQQDIPEMNPCMHNTLISIKGVKRAQREMEHSSINTTWQVRFIHAEEGNWSH